MAGREHDPMTSTPVAHPRSAPLPRRWGITTRDVGALLTANGVFIVLMWVRHGGLEQLGSPAGVLTAAGQLAALLGTYLALIQLVLMGRSPWLDQAFGPDRLAWWHRWLGFGTVWLIGGHVILTLTGWAIGDGRNLVAEAGELLGGYPYVLWALAGFVMFLLVGLTSLRAVRRRVSYETWYWLHWYAYLGIALAFLHQLFVGVDFTHDQLAAIYWIGLYVITAVLVVVFRFGAPVVLNQRHHLCVASVVTEAPGVTSVYLAGRDLDRLAVRSGQYFIVRFLTRRTWWRAHPYSISSAPNGEWLRFTVKALGDDSARIGQIPVGTKVFAEGPYGNLSGAVRTRPRVTLIAAGIGIAPMRALLESLAARPGELTLLYRAAKAEDLVLRAEIDLLAQARGARVHYLVGRRGVEVPLDPMTGATIRNLVPDITGQDVFLCGPDDFMARVERSLVELGVPARQVHAERFTY
jgi:predicted ferric reductase